MASADAPRSGPRLASGVVLLSICLTLGVTAAATAQSDDAADDGGSAVASFLADLLSPGESFAPVEIELTGSLPRSGTFQGVELVIDRVHVTNTHPYTMFGEPRPGELFYVVVEMTARNATAFVNEYGFSDETFDLRTWSGRLLAHVPAPGRYAFDRLEAGDEKTDELVFGTEDPDVLDGSALLVGRPPDTQLVIPLTAPPLAADYPVPAVLADPGPYQGGSVLWSLVDGEASLDRPPDVCCPDTGSRADDGELFLTLRLSGLVSGSAYGQATVSSDAVRLVVDGVSVAPLGFEGRANVPEGEAVDLPLTWLVHEADAGLTLQLLDGADIVVRVPVLVGDAAQAAALPAPSPAATSQAVEIEDTSHSGPDGSACQPEPGSIRHAATDGTSRHGRHRHAAHPLRSTRPRLGLHGRGPRGTRRHRRRTGPHRGQRAGGRPGLPRLPRDRPEGYLAGERRRRHDPRLGARHVPRGPRTSRRAIPLGDRPRVAQRGRSRGRRRRALEVPR